jgi:glycosyltransferase involved in cell wall biosynthesis
MTVVAGSSRKLRVFVIGLRAFPNVPGGVETHAQNLYPLIAENGHEVIVASRSPYHQLNEWNGIRFVKIWAPKSKFLEAIVHSTLAVFRAAILRPDVVHIHAVGPSLVVPLARLAALKVVVTHHGPDYDREKWNWMAKSMLRLGECLGMRFSNNRIVISPVIEEMVKRMHKRESVVIPNGVRIPELNFNEDLVRKRGLQPTRYVLMVSRFVPEKRHFDLIEAFEQAQLDGFKLVLAGDADHPDAYEKSLKERAAENPDVVLTGFIGGDDLASLFQYAAAFVLPSSHEGLPISLLEALSFGLPCIASGIPANRSVGLDSEAYFELGDVSSLADKLRRVCAEPLEPIEREQIRAWVDETYNWKKIARQTCDVYLNL